MRDTGHLLEKEGFSVKVLDLVNMSLSSCYNPFTYLKSDNDVQKLVTNLFKSVTPKGSQSSDPFWDTSASMLLMSLIFLLKYEAPQYEQNFDMVLELLRYAEVKEDQEDYSSPLDDLFKIIEAKNPHHIAVKYYKSYRVGAPRTLQSIQVTLQSKLEKFNLRGLANLTIEDEMELDKLGEKKIALIPSFFIWGIQSLTFLILWVNTPSFS